MDFLISCFMKTLTNFNVSYQDKANEVGGQVYIFWFLSISFQTTRSLYHGLSPLTRTKLVKFYPENISLKPSFSENFQNIEISPRRYLFE